MHATPPKLLMMRKLKNTFGQFLFVLLNNYLLPFLTSAALPSFIKVHWGLLPVYEGCPEKMQL